MKSPLRLLRYIAIISICILSARNAVAADPYQAMGITRPDTAVAAQDFSLDTLDGSRISLAAYRGQVVLLNFWATWCAPCRREMPSMQKLWQLYKTKNFAVLAVSEDAGKLQKVTDFIAKIKVEFPVLLDHDFKIADDYMVPGLPASYLIGRNGTIAATVVGSQDWSRPEARALIDYLLAQGH
jgi:peroxiredoxin